VEDSIVLEPQFWSEGESWGIELAIPNEHLPPGLFAANAYAIYGVRSERRYRAHAGRDGEAPDFHALESFVALDAALLASLGPTGSGWR
jgi:hypothetical protein